MMEELSVCVCVDVCVVFECFRVMLYTRDVLRVEIKYLRPSLMVYNSSDVMCILQNL